MNEKSYAINTPFTVVKMNTSHLDKQNDSTS